MALRWVARDFTPKRVGADSAAAWNCREEANGAQGRFATGDRVTAKVPLTPALLYICRTVLGRVGYKSFPGDMNSRGRNLAREEAQAGNLLRS
jgi:hypothetical protein